MNVRLVIRAFFLLALLYVGLGYSNAAQARTKGEAYAECMTNSASIIPHPPPADYSNYQPHCTDHPNGGEDGWWQAGYTYDFLNSGNGVTYHQNYDSGPQTSYSGFCDDPAKTYNEETHTCGTPANCATAPDKTNLSWKGNGGTCIDGCSYGVILDPSDPSTAYRILNVGTADETTFAKKATATGGTCTVGDSPGLYSPSEATCTSIGSGYAECVQPDGKHCITSPRGTQLCWAPGETGQRETADGKDSADRQIAPATNTPPGDQKDPVPQITSTTNINGNIYNTTGYSGSGTSGTQSNTGGGNDPGQGGHKGDGDTPCGDSDPTCAGGSGVGQGDAYTFDGEGPDSVGDVFNHLKGGVEASPIVSTTAAFFVVQVSGSCPSYTKPADAWLPAMSFNFCDPGFASIVAFAKFVILALAAFCAVRIAIY